MHIGRFGLIDLEHPLAVEAEIMRVGPHEADGIGRSGQVSRPPLFERGQEDRLDPQRLADNLDIEVEFLAAGLQQRADRVGPSLWLVRILFGRVR